MVRWRGGRSTRRRSPARSRARQRRTRRRRWSVFELLEKHFTNNYIMKQKNNMHNCKIKCIVAKIKNKNNFHVLLKDMKIAFCAWVVVRSQLDTVFR